MNKMQFTLGIEEEYQVIDPETRELTSHEQRIVETANKFLDEQVKAEMHQAVVEVGTRICSDINDAREQIIYLRKSISEVATSLGYRIGAAGTHPFSAWQKQLLTVHPRYDQIVNELQDTARSNLIFGLHVHVGIEDRNMAIHLANSIRYFLPHLFALSTNSPFWEGRNTGFKSFRTKVFDKFPRTGIPDYFETVAEYDSYINLLVKTGCIDNAKKIWWDIRAHPFFPTIEIRICDIPLTVNETICIAALVQALVAKLYKLRQANLNFMIYRRALINENKWRASRYGIDGQLIDFGLEKEVSTRHLLHELLDFVDDVLDELGSREAVQYIHQILEHGTGADRQLKVYEETGSLEKVVDYIISQTVEGVL
ncbi:MAG: carboxylate-amine ligase [Bacteroidia bacterium]